MKKLIAIGTSWVDQEWMVGEARLWHTWNDVRIYIADSIDEAKKMDGRRGKSAIEIDMSQSKLLVKLPELPND
jgi:hypothetical protein